MINIFAHATAVLPDRVIEDALVAAEDGVITEVTAARPGAVPAEAVDLRGALLLPGLVDTHSDGLEKELNPRPNAEFDVDFAVASFEGRVRAAGVTTIYHGIGYQTAPRKGRDLDRAVAITEAVARRAGGDPMVDHRFLFRLDARDPAALAALGPRLAALDLDVPPLVSYEDHTPGQGQYRDPVYYRKWLEGSQGISAEQAQTKMDALVADRDTRAWHRPVALDWLSEQARTGRARVLAHDPVTAEEVALAHERGVRVAEFPTTVEAARAARELGLDIVAGAPNVLRGGSHSGNVAARELIAAGLADALSSDYLPSAMLAAAMRLAADGLVPLHRAVALVTSGPARVAGLTDRGALVPGARADLVAVAVAGGWPTVRLSHCAADRIPEARPLELSW
ncbi:alpha-D-ribose 1-methylphosphonate 5-triphosphate diphosphatase [Spongiactinospora rosea]|uniref:Alpha-D-ribose 1-methylphosphonate 5-triphosphate diphosphatase n=1 Tax=Spongiactinospora rosea TaxID=2248750 RepID=A0A366LZ77_9ACTN|nr:alpha-D-ribose 1-methylphosphonate 5-triphosphate diphosphatase [Spongiactinospora rosea]RBQ19278.1 alpha-D-ribose 1-methylphosphonate 5-triphosphate diphosphatase [Spongiactinospora rosea]